MLYMATISAMGLASLCGVVAALGEGVDAYAVGDRVLHHGKMLEAHGGFAEYAVHDALTALPCPEGPEGAEGAVGEGKLTAAAAAAIPCAAWTAYKALHDKLRIEAEDVLLVYGASGGVGSFAVQYARLVGARVIAVCSGKNAAYVRGLGAESVIDYTSPEGGSVKAAVLALTGGRGVDKALDLVGEDTTATCADVLAFDGIVCPAVSNAQPERTHDQFMRGVTFAQVTLGGAHGEGERARRKLRQLAQTATDAITENSLTVPVTRTVGLDEIPAALDEMFHAHTAGKVVFVPE